MNASTTIPAQRTLAQVTGWVLLWLLISLVIGNGIQRPGRHLVAQLPLLVGVGVVVAANLGLLLPQLYFRGRRGWYVLAGLALVLLLTLALFPKWWAARPARFGGPRPGLALLRAVLPLTVSLLGSSLVEVTRYAVAQERAVVRFLRSQINPHFLFNSLNNIYTLTLLGDERAPESLLKLSGMLRYVLYGSDADTVPLGREIDYLRDFVDLARLRDSAAMRVTLRIDDRHPERAVAPLLFVPLVENAFKHGNPEDPTHGFVEIDLTTGPDSIDFRVRNSRPARPGPTGRAGEGGIGLDNLRRRLELLYPGRHRLEIRPTDHDFTVHLQLRQA